MGDDRRQPPDRTAPMGRFDDDATRMRPRDEAGLDPDATRMRQRGGFDPDFDETRIRPPSDGTRMLPPTDDEPRWEARAAVPPAGTVPQMAPGYEYYEEPVPPPDDRNWLRPLLFGVIGLLLLGVLLTGVWLIYTADNEPPAPQVGTSTAPTAPATTAPAPPPPATTAPPTTEPAEPEMVKVPEGLVGITEDEARQKLEDAGLRVQVTRREDATMAPNTVVEVEPGPGSDVEANSVVRIFVAVAPKPGPSSSRGDGNG